MTYWLLDQCYFPQDWLYAARTLREFSELCPYGQRADNTILKSSVFNYHCCTKNQFFVALCVVHVVHVVQTELPTPQLNIYITFWQVKTFMERQTNPIFNVLYLQTHCTMEAYRYAEWYHYHFYRKFHNCMYSYNRCSLVAGGTKNENHKTRVYSYVSLPHQVQIFG